MNFMTEWLSLRTEQVSPCQLTTHQGYQEHFQLDTKLRDQEVRLKEVMVFLRLLSRNFKIRYRDLKTQFRRLDKSCLRCTSLRQDLKIWILNLRRKWLNKIWAKLITWLVSMLVLTVNRWPLPKTIRLVKRYRFTQEVHDWLKSSRSQPHVNQQKQYNSTLKQDQWP